MYESNPEHEKLLQLLSEMPSFISNLTEGMTSIQLHTPPPNDNWSLNDVLAHLRSCSDMWGKYIRLILKEDKPTFKAMNPATWIKQTDYPQQEFRASLAAYTKQRNELLPLLRSLSPEQLHRTATVTGAGKPIVRSVFAYIEWLAVHERSHRRQIKNMVKAMKGQ